MDLSNLFDAPVAVISSDTVFQSELEWLQRILGYRADEKQTDIRKIPQLYPPTIAENAVGGYARQVRDLELGFEDRLLLIIALAPVVAPNFLDREIAFWVKRQGGSAADLVPLWGFIYGQMYRGLLPTALFYIYVLAGNGFEARMEISRRLLYRTAPILLNKLVVFSDTPAGESPLAAIASVPKDILLELLDVS
jgi:hypothetical protein